MEQFTIQDKVFRVLHDRSVVVDGVCITGHRVESMPPSPGTEIILRASQAVDWGVAAAGAEFLSRVVIEVDGPIDAIALGERVQSAVQREPEDLWLVMPPDRLIGKADYLTQVDRIQCSASEADLAVGGPLESDDARQLWRQMHIAAGCITPANVDAAMERLFSLRNAGVRTVTAAPDPTLSDEDQTRTWMKIAVWIGAYLRAGGHLQYRSMANLIEPMLVVYHRREEMLPEPLRLACVYLLDVLQGRIEDILLGYWNKVLPGGSVIRKNRPTPSQKINLATVPTTLFDSEQIQKIAENRKHCESCSWNLGFDKEAGQTVESLSVCVACQCPRKRNRVSLLTGLCPLTPPKFNELIVL